MTSAAALLPAPPAPPHDPRSIMLDLRAGWRIAGAPSGIEVSPLDGALTLSPAPGGIAPLADACGAFGGLVPPDNVALGPDGVILLLCRRTGRLLRFDRCDCAFVPLPCIGGLGDGARQLDDPRGITARFGNLYVCDTGHRRVLVFGLRGLTLRAIWRQPPGLPQPWLPAAVAVDRRGRIFVADQANACIHLFHATGRFVRTLDQVGAVVHLTVDDAGRLYAQLEGIDAISVIDPEKWATTHRPIETQTRSDEVAARFSPLPFAVTPDGDLRLGPLCADAGADSFDPCGQPIAPPSTPSPRYLRSGTLISRALDSRLHRCQWDRLELDGEFLEMTTVSAAVYSAETQLPDALIAQLPDSAWSACPTLSGATGTPWDCMLRAPQGRYLWLKLTFSGDGNATSRVTRARVVFPRVSLRRYLPGTFGSDPLAADFTDRFLAIFDRTFRGIESTIDWQARLYDPLSAPADDRDPQRDFLSWLATWIGVTLDRSWPVERRRRYLKSVGKLLPLRGTLSGLRKHLLLYLGLPERDECKEKSACGPCTSTPPPRWRPPQLVLEHYRLRRWMFLGRGRLGNEARLWGDSIVNRSRLGGPDITGNARLDVTRLDTWQDPERDPFWVYAHKLSVFAPASFARSPGARRGLDRLIRAERPAHAAYSIVYVEPRFRIGIQSMIGFDTAIGCYPDGGVRLDRARLGRATVLGGAAPNDSMAVGLQSRIGATTRLT